MTFNNFQSKIGFSEEKIFTVSSYIEALNQQLKTIKAKIVGEVSEVKIGPTGHVYFSLKDEKDKSVLNCIIWKSRYDMYGVELKEGVKIVAFGCSSIYAPSGRLSFIAETIELAGEGALKKEYERLKKKLMEEGIFEVSKKRPIPRYVQRIGVITSRQGAVLADFLNNLGKFGFKTEMIDSRVEGQGAVEDLLLSIKSFKKRNIDVLIIIRGGGSMESLIAFNNEILVREIAAFPAPVIAGIGHHRDVPLSAMAADVMVSTPTAAANLLNQSWEQASLYLERLERQIFDGFESSLINARSLLDKAVDIVCGAGDLILEKYRQMLIKLRIAFQRFKDALQNVKINLRTVWQKSVSGGFKSLLAATSQQLSHAERIVNLNNPERQLGLGYSIARSRGKIVRSVKNVIIGGDININVVDGTIDSKIKNIHPVK